MITVTNYVDVCYVIHISPVGYFIHCNKQYVQYGQYQDSLEFVRGPKTMYRSFI